MSIFERSNPNPLVGDELRDRAADLLSALYGAAKIEHRVYGKKSDIYFLERNLGKVVRVYVEAKDYKERLKRSHVVNIWADYSGIIEKNAPANLLIVSRHGLSADAQAYVDEEQSQLRHLTIWELESEVLGLEPYLQSLEGAFSGDGLDQYFIESRASLFAYEAAAGATNRKQLESEVDLRATVNEWIDNEDYTPLAILGGYGAGKTSFSKRIVSEHAIRALKDPTRRQPILIRLGSIVHYSDIDGLLGAMFTHEYPIRGFSFQRFMQFNRDGRFLVILDGFDEMKHAMSWAVFRSQIAQLNRFIDGRSKVILLGRPSAFLTDQEHVHVLRGHRIALNQPWLKIPEWPEFREFELDSFDSEQIGEFCGRYLRFMERKNAIRDGREPDLQWSTDRAEEVARIAQADTELFGKPVHSKILVELASQRDVDLSTLRGESSRWGLYTLFFDIILEREMEKEARRPVSERARRSFLENLCLWLWTSKDGSTSFVADDVPDDLLNDFPDDYAPDKVGKLRELLTGPFIERKPSDTFYFSHRSFAEYLVASRIASTPPTAREHTLYSQLFRGGVADFLSDARLSKFASEWISSLGEAKGKLSVQYLEFIADKVGPAEEVVLKLPSWSPWGAVLRAVDQARREGSTNQALIRSTTDLLRVRGGPDAGLLLTLIQPGYPMVLTGEPCRAIDSALSVAAALMARLLKLLRLNVTRSAMTLPVEAESTLRLARSAMIGPVKEKGGRAFHFSWQTLLGDALDLALGSGVELDLAEGGSPVELSTVYAINMPRMRAALPLNLREAFDHAFAGNRTLNDFTVVAHVSKGRGRRNELY